MRPAKIVAIIIGALLIIIGLAVLAPGSLLLWINGTQKDSNGFFSTSFRDLNSSGYALITPEVQLNFGSGNWIPGGGTVQIRATAGGTAPIFVGIGPTDQVTAYLSGVAYDEVTNLGWFSASVQYSHHEGSCAVHSARTADLLDGEARGNGHADAPVAGAERKLDRCAHERRRDGSGERERQPRCSPGLLAASGHRLDRRRSGDPGRGDPTRDPGGAAPAPADAAGVSGRPLWALPATSLSAPELSSNHPTVRTRRPTRGRPTRGPRTSSPRRLTRGSHRSNRHSSRRLSSNRPRTLRRASRHP